MCLFLGASLGVVLLGSLIGGQAGRSVTLMGGGLLAGVFVIIILQKPYWGLIVTICSLPVLDLIKSLPMAGWIVPFIGGLTLFASILKSREKSAWRSYRVLNYLTFWGVLFLTWITITHYSAATLDGNRSWVLTFGQLLVLALVTGLLTTTIEKLQKLMWAFSVVALVSALFAVFSSSGGAEVYGYAYKRAEGLAGGANDAARYFVVGFVFLNHLKDQTVEGQARALRLIALSGMAILMIAVAYTGSRSGILILAVIIVLILLRRTRQVGRKQILSIALVGGIALLFLPFSIFKFFGSSIVPSIGEGADTVGLRYKLWDAGIRMWADHPLTGVGIGQFVYKLRDYTTELNARHLELGAHNMYIQILAETGAIGLLLFSTLLLLAFVSFIRGYKSSDPRISSISWTWLLAFLTMLLGGITKHDHYDKLIWMCMGIATTTLLNGGRRPKNSFGNALKSKR